MRPAPAHSPFGPLGGLLLLLLLSTLSFALEEARDRNDRDRHHFWKFNFGKHQSGDRRPFRHLDFGKHESGDRHLLGKFGFGQQKSGDRLPFFGFGQHKSEDRDSEESGDRDSEESGVREESEESGARQSGVSGDRGSEESEDRDSKESGDGDSEESEGRDSEESGDRDSERHGSRPHRSGDRDDFEDDRSGERHGSRPHRSGDRKSGQHRSGPHGSEDEDFGGHGQRRGTKYLLGIGKADITGPVAGLTLAGYAQFSQVGTGIRQRIFSRAFIIGDVENPQERVVYVVMDNLVGELPIRLGVLEALAASGGEYAIYNQHNVALAAVHSHSTPGAWWGYFLPSVPNLGFDKQSYQALVDGTVLAIKRAHESLQEGHIDIGMTELNDVAINRSLFAYLHNPAEERARYKGQTDTTMTLLRFRRASDGKNIGLLTWFAVHGTSLYSNNTHVAGDNKGLAAWMVEQKMKEDDSAADGFIAAFSQANLADASPNIEGAWCEDGSGQPCSLESAACPDGKVTKCHGRGPLFRALDLGVSSCHEIARRQAVAAERLMASMDHSSVPIRGRMVKGFHFYHKMAWWKFTLPNGTEATTCPAALGYSFAAGTTDGPGLFDFIQSESDKPKNPLWKYVFGILRPPSLRQKRCQRPKPILFDGGEISFPYAWEPNIVDIAMFRIGQLFIILSPSEVTTMSGRRWKAAVAKHAGNFIVKDPIVTIASPVNSYAHYVATPEEYDVQRYEGASTIFGRNELDAYINLTVSSMHYLQTGSRALPEQGKLPPDNRRRSINFNFGVFGDSSPGWKGSYGKVLQQPDDQYRLGEEVQVTFQAANPRNNLRLEDTYAAVERLGKNGKWTRVRDDSDWFLLFTWRESNKLLHHSEVDIKWETGGNAEPGTYRLKYYGDSKSFVKGIQSFEGTSRQFRLVK
ncbi:hypothetical protein CDD83_3650 [Cordyceps sp. RAO-2017]|nr:hypothetical protein CDD83_3650 [Cordyceps sp. RAO-2017]